MPSVTMPKRKGSRSGASRSRITIRTLYDLLSEFIAVGQGSVELCRVIQSHSPRPEIRRAADALMRRTERNADLLRAAIRDLGGNPFYVSPAAQVAQQRVRSLIELAAPARLQAAVDLENLLLTEAKDQADWVLLKAILPGIADAHARTVLSGIVDEVEQEAEQRVEWARKTLERARMEMLVAESFPLTRPRARARRVASARRVRRATA